MELVFFHHFVDRFVTYCRQVLFDIWQDANVKRLVQKENNCLANYHNHNVEYWNPRKQTVHKGKNHFANKRNGVDWCPDDNAQCLEQTIEEIVACVLKNPVESFQIVLFHFATYSCVIYVYILHLYSICVNHASIDDCFVTISVKHFD